MFFDVFMIILSAFAVFGLFCIAEILFEILGSSTSPKSVTVLLYREDSVTYSKVRQLQNNICNNEIIFVSDSLPEKNIYPDSRLTDFQHAWTEVENVLFTNQ